MRPNGVLHNSYISDIDLPVVLNRCSSVAMYHLNIPRTPTHPIGCKHFWEFHVATVLRCYTSSDHPIYEQVVRRMGVLKVLRGVLHRRRVGSERGCTPARAATELCSAWVMDLAIN